MASEHGTVARYTNGRCRCDLCVEARRAYDARRHPPGPPRAEPEHGTHSCYVHHRCRCDECRRANTDYQRKLCGLLRERLAADPDAAPHGVASTYKNWGCRCAACSAVHRAACSEYGKRRRKSA